MVSTRFTPFQSPMMKHPSGFVRDALRFSGDEPPQDTAAPNTFPSADSVQIAPPPVEAAPADPNSQLLDSLLKADTAGFSTFKSQLRGSSEGPILVKLPKPDSLFPVKLQGLDLTGIKLISATGEKVILDGKDLGKLDFSGSDFTQCSLKGAKFIGSTLNDCKFNAVVLEGADFRNAELATAQLDQAKLKGAKYNQNTMLPNNFDPEACGMVFDLSPVSTTEPPLVFPKPTPSIPDLPTPSVPAPTYTPGTPDTRDADQILREAEELLRRIDPTLAELEKEPPNAKPKPTGTDTSSTDPTLGETMGEMKEAAKELAVKTGEVVGKTLDEAGKALSELWRKWGL